MAPHPPRPGGRRIAERQPSGSGAVLSRLRSAGPGLLGTAILLAAGTGAVGVGSDPVSHAAVTSGYVSAASAQASVLTGRGGVGSTDTAQVREEAVSRDSQREALEDAADQELQAAVEAQAKERNAALAKLAASAEKHASKLLENTWSLPIAPGRYRITATFGLSSGLWANTHTGLDFAASSGTPVKSVANGAVTETSYAGAYGNRVIVTLDDGTEVWYCHLSAFSVRAGQHVSSGQTIGSVGSTGNSTGPHLHLEVRPGAGDAVDPRKALEVHGVRP